MPLCGFFHCLFFSCGLCRRPFREPDFLLLKGAFGIGSIFTRDVRHLHPRPSRSRAKMAYIPGGAVGGLFSGSEAAFDRLLFV